MTTKQPIDQLNLDLLKQHSEHEHPLITITLPTERSGHNTNAAAIRLRNLLDEAEKQLTAQGADAATAQAWLSDARELVQDPEFWGYQAEGLAILISGGETSTARLPQHLDERVAVGDDWLYSALAPALGGTQEFHLLALSRNKMRLFLTDGHTLHPLDLGDIPASEEAIYDDYDPQRFRQEAPQNRGGSEVSFHGHTGGDETERVYNERFFREVADELASRFTTAEQRPLILAGVEAMTDKFRPFITWDAGVLDGSLKGATEALTAPEILQGIKEPLELWDKDRADKLAQQIEDARSGKRFLTAADDIRQAAEQGQVAQLLVPATTPDSSGALTDLDRTIGLVLRSGGTIHTVPAGQDYELAALTRW